MGESLKERRRVGDEWLRLSLKDWFAPYQLVGEVTAHQGYDGYLV